MLISVWESWWFCLMTCAHSASYPRDSSPCCTCCRMFSLHTEGGFLFITQTIIISYYLHPEHQWWSECSENKINSQLIETEFLSREMMPRMYEPTKISTNGRSPSRNYLKVFQKVQNNMEHKEERTDKICNKHFLNFLPWLRKPIMTIRYQQHHQLNLEKISGA